MWPCACLTRAPPAARYDINALADDAYLNFRKTPGKYEVHELWSDEWFNDNTINATVPHHGVKVYRIHNS